MDFWIIFIFSAFCLGLAAFLSTKTKWGETRTDGVFNSLMKRCEEAALLFTGGPSITIEKSTSALGLTVGLWALLAVVLGNLYSGTVLLHLMRQTPKLPFNSIESLAKCVELDRCQLYITNPGYSNYQRLIANQHLTNEEKLLRQQLMRKGVKELAMPKAANIMLDNSSGVFNVFLSDSFLLAAAIQVLKQQWFLQCVAGKIQLRITLV